MSFVVPTRRLGFVPAVSHLTGDAFAAVLAADAVVVVVVVFRIVPLESSLLCLRFIFSMLLLSFA